MSDEDRLNLVATRVVEALQPVITELAITEDELHAAADYLNDLGRAGLFRGLFDISFAMTIIDRKRASQPGTRPSLEGPEYVPDAPERPGGSLYDTDPGPEAVPLTITGRVLDAATGDAVAGAEVDLWHADEHGGYDRDGFELRGVVRTDSTGRYQVQTIVPRDYAEHEDDLIGDLLARMGRSNFRPAHIHVKVRVEGQECLTSQLYRSDSPFLALDYVVGAVSSDGILSLTEARDTRGRRRCTAEYDFRVPRPASR